jgi:magnesium chelatase family protein
MQVISVIHCQYLPQKIFIELNSRFQIPSFQILGLPAPEIQEARERIMAAFTASGFEFPKKKVVVNLAPSSIRKTGTGHDLAIAVKILEQVLDLKWPEEILAWGELGLNGKIKACGQVASLIEVLLPEKERCKAALLVISSQDARLLRQYLHWRKSNQLPIPENIEILCVDRLGDLPEVIENRKSVPGICLAAEDAEQPLLSSFESTRSLLPLGPSLKRVIDIAMTGRHHTLLLGPKGTGKSQALEWFKALTPPSLPDQTWVRLLQSEQGFETPVRRVHAQVRPAHLLGSWSSKGFRSGELGLSHGGLFIADEFLEWPRDSKECLREPLESKTIFLTRTLGSLEQPCDFQFVGTGNLCKCGGMPSQFLHLILPDLLKKIKESLPSCRCKPIEVQEYFNKLSGPVADRIDLVIIHTTPPQFENE